MQRLSFARSVRLVVLASWLCSATSVTQAQSANDAGHHGPQVAIAIGGGLNPGPCAGCVGWGEPVVAPALMLRVGWAVSPRMVLSADLGGWGRTLDGTAKFTTWQMMTTQFYPDPTGGLYFNAGVGRAVDATDVRTTLEFATVTTHTLGLSAGIGYDRRASYSLSPSLDVLYAMPQCRCGGGHRPRRDQLLSGQVDAQVEPLKPMRAEQHHIGWLREHHHGDGRPASRIQIGESDFPLEHATIRSLESVRSFGLHAKLL
jgi:hypothetical protein